MAWMKLNIKEINISGTWVVAWMKQNISGTWLVAWLNIKLNLSELGQ